MHNHHHADLLRSPSLIEAAVTMAVPDDNMGLDFDSATLLLEPSRHDGGGGAAATGGSGVGSLFYPASCSPYHPYGDNEDDSDEIFAWRDNKEDSNNNDVDFDAGDDLVMEEGADDDYDNSLGTPGKATPGSIKGRTDTTRNMLLTIPYQWFSNISSMVWSNRMLFLIASVILLEPVLALLAFKLFSAKQLNMAIAWITGLPAALSMTLFTIGFAFLVVLGSPSSPLTLAAGFLFGTIPGVVLSIIASGIAASISFAFARHLGSRELIRTWVEKSFSSARIRAFDLSICRDAFRFVFFVRLSPAFPFGLSNYVFSITSVPYLTFLIASLLGILPGTFILAASGSLADNLFFESGSETSVSAAADPADPLMSTMKTILMIIGLLASVFVFYIVSRATQKGMEEDLVELEHQFEEVPAEPL